MDFISLENIRNKFYAKYIQIKTDIEVKKFMKKYHLSKLDMKRQGGVTYNATTDGNILVDIFYKSDDFIPYKYGLFAVNSDGKVIYVKHRMSLLFKRQV